MSPPPAALTASAVNTNSVLDKSIESGRTKERKRKDKVMGMGWKNVAIRIVGVKSGGKATHGYGKAYMKGGRVK